jgi:putative N6-adenine-specific DNA methylase
MSRLALKVLVFIEEFAIQNETDYYTRLYQFEWEKYIDSNNTISVDSVVNSEQFRHANYMSLKCKDAIVDRMRSKTGERPNVDPQNADLKINIHIRNKTVTLSLDSTGKSLHMRGYRAGQGIAPINEVLAAGILDLIAWDKDTPIIDPMCGSATFLCEAAFMFLGISPQRKDRNYAFMKWRNFDNEIFDAVLKESFSIKNNLPPKLLTGFDKDPKMVSIALKNIDEAGLQPYISVSEQDFFFQEGSNNAIVLFNPPYDGRMKESEVLQFYKFIGDKLKSSFAGCTAWIISGHLDGLKNIGLRPSRRIPLLNGSINSLLVRLDMYVGSKKAKFQNLASNEKI